MAFNRVLDANIDARNPRTQMRHIPAGHSECRFAWGFVGAVRHCVFRRGCGMLNPLCLALAPLALGFVFFYSFTKRFTSLSHLVLGFCLGIAPAAAWIAMGGSLDPRILWLTAAVTFWTAGFDIIYSCQDYDFDVSSGLYSVPRKFGISGALWIARALHVAMLRSSRVGRDFISAGSVAGIAAVAVLLIYEHRLVKADDLSRVTRRFSP